ncbi:MAG: hypothetical protein EHM78_25890 [Myxococcaceae bacterium]|nr:MAG: hypothetical protein EHM78_25890 [Myxococcaceae bacterium]
MEVTLPVRQRRGEGGKTPDAHAHSLCRIQRITRITRLLALAIKFEDMVNRGEVHDYADLARLGYVTRARLTQIMNLLLLAPDIQEALLISQKERGIPERRLRAAIREVNWVTQRVLLSELIRGAA